MIDISSDIVMIRILTHCPFCKGEAILNSTVKQYMQHREGTHVQNAWPEKSIDWRETLISGSHGYCFDQAFKEEEEDEYIGDIYGEGWLRWTT